jgi:threonine dehydratase
MKEPTKIKLTDNPKNKNVKLTPLPSTQNYDIEMSDDIWIKNEDNKQNNSQSISELDSM